MRIGCLQFAPQVGDVDNNLNRADAVLSKASLADLEELDLLVLPELAFTGYNFKSLREISPFLEPPGSGISSLWARTTALKYNCRVVVGYPEKVDVSTRWPTSPEYYNSAILINNDGDTVVNYRKRFLYYTDETWALEGKNGFYGKKIPGLGRTALGICMDINPYKFEAPWNAFEFAFHILEVKANLVIVSMAWLTREDGQLFSRRPHEPDLESLVYWVQRLEPVIEADKGEEVIVVFCNRSGVEDDAVYSGTSAVLGIKRGQVFVYGLLGRGVKELLVVDTAKKPYGKLIQCPESHGTYTYDATPQLMPMSPTETDIGDDPDARPPEEITSYLLQSPQTPVAISLFDEEVIPEEDPMSPGLPKKPFASLIKAPLSPVDSKPSFAYENDLVSQTLIEDDVVIDTPITPSSALEKPKLVIPTSADSATYKTSPYPWQQQRPQDSVILGGNVVVNADPISPTTPIELDDYSAISLPTGSSVSHQSSVSYQSAMVATLDDDAEWTPLSPMSPATIWKEPSVSSAIASLRRDESVTQSIDNAMQEMAPEASLESMPTAAKGLVLISLGSQAQRQENELRSTEMVGIVNNPKTVILGAVPQHRNRQVLAEHDSEPFLDRPQSPKSRNASQTREGGANDAPIDPVFAQNRLVLSRNSTPGDIGREIETWRPRSNPVLAGRSSTRRGHRTDQPLDGPVNGRSRSLSGLDHMEHPRLRGVSVSGVYTGGNPYKRPQSQGRYHKAITPRGVRRSFDGPQMRRVSRGRQPGGRRPGPAGHERPNSASSAVSIISRATRGSGTQRAVSLTPPPPPPLVDGMLVLNSAPRSRSFSRRRFASGDDILVDVSLVSPHCLLHGRDSPQVNNIRPRAISDGGDRRSLLSQGSTADSAGHEDPEAMQSNSNEVLSTPRFATPKAMTRADVAQESARLEAASAED